MTDDIIRNLIDENIIISKKKIADDQIQPASLDLRLGEKAWRVRASFLPGPNKKVREMARKIDPSNKKSVMAFQRAAGLQVDGKFGKATLRELRAIQGKKMTPKKTVAKKTGETAGKVEKKTNEKNGF